MGWFKLYLSNRKQFVEIDNKKSEMVDVRLCVPQGSILGPILCLLFVNDISKCDYSVNFTEFADDTSVQVSAKTLGEAAKTKHFFFVVFSL